MAGSDEDPRKAGGGVAAAEPDPAPPRQARPLPPDPEDWRLGDLGAAVGRLRAGLVLQVCASVAAAAAAVFGAGYSFNEFVVQRTRPAAETCRIERDFMALYLRYHIAHREHAEAEEMLRFDMQQDGATWEEIRHAERTDPTLTALWQAYRNDRDAFNEYMHELVTLSRDPRTAPVVLASVEAAKSGDTTAVTFLACRGTPTWRVPDALFVRGVNNPPAEDRDDPPALPLPDGPDEPSGSSLLGPLPGPAGTPR
jgi:hypothetical protein